MIKNRNFILKSELFKKDHSYNNPKENERMKNEEWGVRN